MLRFAMSCFVRPDTKQDLWFATSDTISKKADHRFADIFQEIYDDQYAARFEEAGIEKHTLIDFTPWPAGRESRGRLYLGL